MPIEHVTLETPRGKARGMWHVGDGLQPVLIVHGYFGANRVGPARLYVKIANALNVHGCDVLRLDVVGTGDSDGKYENITLTSFIDDFMHGSNWLMNRMSTNANRPILIGHSLGANVTLCMSEYGNWKGLILVAPEVRPKGGVNNLFTENQLEEIRKVGHTIRKGIKLNARFIEEIGKVSALDIACRVPVPTVVIQGTNDELYDPFGANDLTDKLKKCKMIRIDGADHNFLGPMYEKALVKSISESIQWVNRQ